MLFSVRINLHNWLSTPRALPCPKHARSLRHFHAHTPLALGGPDTADLPRQLPCPVMLQHARVGCQAEGASCACLEFFDSDTGRFRRSCAQHEAHLALKRTIQPDPGANHCTHLLQPPSLVVLLGASPHQQPAALPLKYRLLASSGSNPLDGSCAHLLPYVALPHDCPSSTSTLLTSSPPTSLYDTGDTTPSDCRPFRVCAGASADLPAAARAASSAAVAAGVAVVVGGRRRREAAVAVLRLGLVGARFLLRRARKPALRSSLTFLSKPVALMQTHLSYWRLRFHLPLQRLYLDLTALSQSSVATTRSGGDVEHLVEDGGVGVEKFGR